MFYIDKFTAFPNQYPPDGAKYPSYEISLVRTYPLEGHDNQSYEEGPVRHQADDAGVGHRLCLGRVLSWNVGGDGQTIGAGSHTEENQIL